MSDKSPSRLSVMPASGWMLVVSLSLAAWRLWTSLCMFVGQEWNDVRLRPAWLLADGLPLYPDLDTGPITTWIYGPVTPFLMLPATLASTIQSALLAAGAMNLLLLAGSLTFTSLLWPAPLDGNWPWRIRVTALGLTLLLLPVTFLVFLQADNSALACGLISLTSMARARKEPDVKWWWMAAVFAGAAVFSKWHGIAIVAGGLGWIGLSTGRHEFWRHAGRIILVCVGGVVVTLLVSSSLSAARDTMVILTTRLPLIKPEQFAVRLRELAPGLGVLLILPGLVAMLVIRQKSWWRSTLGLPVIVWLASLPLGLAGTLSTGGHYNSLHGAFYLLPVAMIVLLAIPPDAYRQWSRAAGILALVVLLGLRVVNGFLQPFTPQLDLPTEAANLATNHGRRIWLPWRPLATRLAMGRHDHDEDGLYIRQVGGLQPSHQLVRAWLPPEWDSTFFQVGGMNWSVGIALEEPGWNRQRIGRWILSTRRPVDSGVGNPPPPPHPASQNHGR